MKGIIIVFFSIFSMIFSDVYTPKTKEEENTLNELRKVKLKFGVLSNEFYNDQISDFESVNSILKELLSDYLQLDVKYITGSFYDLYSQFEKNEIDGMGFINRDYKRCDVVKFTSTIFNEKLYVGSKNVPINNLNELDNKKIYYEKGKIYSKYLKIILDNNDLKDNIIEVDDLNLHQNDFILTPHPELYSLSYYKRISNISGSAIGFSKKYKNLISILNNALNEKYRDEINFKVNENKEALRKQNYMDKLTQEEKDFLKSLYKINIAFENELNSVVSYYNQDEKRYKGIAVNLLNQLGRHLNIKIEDVTSEKSTADITILSKTTEREKDFLFSDSFFSLDLFVISLKDVIDKKRTIGVVNDSIEKSVAEKYDTKDNIHLYDSYKELIEALNKKEVNNILIAKNNFDYNKYNITYFESVPVNFSFHKNDILLKNILNKALNFLINKEEETTKAILDRENFEMAKELEEEKSTKKLTVISIVLFLITIVGSLKAIFDNKYKKELEKDSLSGLPNRIIFNKFCNDEKDISGYTFVIDIDNFKELNDKFGHGFGDSIISEFSNFLKNNFKTSHLFRISGDEFYGVFVEELNIILEKLESYKVFCPILKKYDVTYSIGLYKKEETDNISKAFKYSDLALLKSKFQKGFSYVVADQDFIEKKERELKILSILEGDLNELYAVFQPKIDISDNKVIGGEALIRCRSNTLGDIYPNELIPIAEKFDFIHKIDYKIAEETIKFIKELIDSNTINGDFRISFNLSVKTFSKNDLIPTIKSLLEKYDIPGDFLEVEITETILMTDIKDIISKLSALKELSIQISLDDFTAGHSTAKLLPILPIDIIKFDKSLLDCMDHNKEKGKIIYQNLTSMIKALKLKIVSEGIEEERQLNFLKNIKIDYGQGYLISKPLEKNKYIDFISF